MCVACARHAYGAFMANAHHVHHMGTARAEGEYKIHNSPMACAQRVHSSRMASEVHVLGTFIERA